MKYKANDIQLSVKDSTITLYMSEFIYNGLVRIGRQYYKDKRSIDGLIRTYAMIKLHHIIAMSNNYMPIRCEVFRSISKRNYTDYLSILSREMFVNIKQQPIETYRNKDGKYCIKQEPNRYQLLEFGCDILGNQNRVFPIKIPISTIDCQALKIKYNYIRKHYKDVGLEDKRESTMLYNNDELLLVKELVGYIKRLSKNENRSSNNRIYNSISKLGSNYLELVKELLKRIEREDKREQIVRNNLCHTIDNKSVGRFDYYTELRFSIDALDECMCLKDLRDLASLNKVPKYGNDGKLYSTFSRIRRPIRKYVTFRGERLDQASDISCAHFTMLPKIFENNGIEIVPHKELDNWITLTQQGDLYSEVVKDKEIPRDAIKPTFQSFFSIKNEKSYIYGGAEKDAPNRRILCCWFEENYPNIYQALIDWHNQSSISIKSAANRVESEIMNSICDDLRDLGLHPFRLHDAIYLPSSETGDVPFDIDQKVFNYINQKNPIQSKCA